MEIITIPTPPSAGISFEESIILVGQLGRERMWLEQAEAAGLVVRLPLFDLSNTYRIKYPSKVVTKRGEAGRTVVWKDRNDE